MSKQTDWRKTAIVLVEIFGALAAVAQTPGAAIIVEVDQVLHAKPR